MLLNKEKMVDDVTVNPRRKRMQRGCFFQALGECERRSFPVRDSISFEPNALDHVFFNRT
jgi:hypothetical protein